VGSAA
jgi:F-type H+-transporting ATPase subunit alpha